MPFVPVEFRLSSKPLYCFDLSTLNKLTSPGWVGFRPALVECVLVVRKAGELSVSLGEFAPYWHGISLDWPAIPTVDQWLAGLARAESCHAATVAAKLTGDRLWTEQTVTEQTRQGWLSFLSGVRDGLPATPGAGWSAWHQSVPG